MSKSKLKNKVVSARGVDDKQINNKKNKPKYKWSDPRQFQFIKPVKWMPGFRSGKHWKRIVAILYFSLSPLSLVLRFSENMPEFGRYIWVMLLAAPFMVLSFASFYKTRDKYYAIEALIAAAVFAADNYMLVQAMNDLIARG